MFAHKKSSSRAREFPAQMANNEKNVSFDDVIMTMTLGGHHNAEMFSHNDVIKRNHFPRYCPFVWECTGHQWFTLIKGTLTQSFGVSLLSV